MTAAYRLLKGRHPAPDQVPAHHLAPGLVVHPRVRRAHNDAPSQWLMDTFAAINRAAAFALRDQLVNASQRACHENPGADLTRQDHGHHQEGQ